MTTKLKGNISLNNFVGKYSRIKLLLLKTSKKTESITSKSVLFHSRLTAGGGALVVLNLQFSEYGPSPASLLA